MNIIELAEQAGLAYKTPNGKYWIDEGYPDIHLERFAELVAAAALAQPEQEPVAAVELIEIGSEQVIAVAWYDSNAFKVGTKLYTAPPSKPWVSLTGDEIDDIAAESGFGYINVARAIEAKLKEKNT